MRMPQNKKLNSLPDYFKDAPATEGAAAKRLAGGELELKQ